MTQYQTILSIGKSRKIKGFTYADLQSKGMNWPHKRLRELRDKGYKFAEQKEKCKNGAMQKRFWLVT